MGNSSTDDVRSSGSMLIGECCAGEGEKEKGVVVEQQQQQTTLEEW